MDAETVHRIEQKIDQQVLTFFEIACLKILLAIYWELREK